MLASDDVLDVIGEERLRILRQTAVFAAITGPFADSLPEPLVHSDGMTFSQEPTSFGLQNGDEIPNTDQCLILVALLWRGPSFGAFVGQFLDPTLHLHVGT
jgi:hypothetical protein